MKFVGSNPATRRPRPRLTRPAAAYQIEPPLAAVLPLKQPGAMEKQPWYMPFFWPLGHVTKALRLSVTSQALEPLQALEGLGVVARWVWGCWLNMRCGQEKKFMNPKRQSRMV